MRKQFLFLIFLISPLISRSQRVGLVLSGGGSSGMAHIGVIQALEENNIPIDYIAGTSAGALIGGMYAAGISIEEMKAICLTNEFKNMTRGVVEDKYNFYFKTEEDNASWISFEFSIDSIFHASLPTNLINSYPIEITLMEKLAPASAAANYNFDSLFVPFRCVAAEVNSKQQVIFKEGQLSDAVRASMTYPFYIKPIKVNGKLLFDGGLYNNFPADVMLRDFYPDIIIGSSVASNAKPAEDDDIVSQIKNLLMNATDYSVPCESDIMIQMPPNDVGVLNFNNVGPIIESGYLQATKQMSEIKSRILRRVPLEERQQLRKVFRSKMPALVFKKMEINGLSKNQNLYVRRSLQESYFQKEVSVEDFKKQFFRLAGDNKLKGLYPRAFYSKANEGYSLNMDVKRNNQFRAQFGGNFSSRSINQAFIGLQYRYLGFFGLDVTGNSQFGRFYNGGSLKFRFDYPFIVPFFVELGGVINSWDYYQTGTSFFADNKPDYRIQNDSYSELSLGLPVTNKARIKTGIGYVYLNNRYFQVKDFLSTDLPDQTEFYGVSARINYDYNTLNRKQYANWGRNLNIGVRYVNGLERTAPGSLSNDSLTRRNNHNWLQIKVTYDNYFNKYGAVKFGVLAEAYYSTQRFFENYTAGLFMMSAFRPTPDSKTFFLEKFRSNRYIAGGARLLFELKKNLDLRLEMYAFQPYRELERDNNFKATYVSKLQYPRLIGTGILVYSTPIGPIAISGSYYETELKPWSVMFHFGYILFNQHALH